MCDHKTDCKGALDENCPRKSACHPTDVVLPVIVSSLITLIFTICVVLAMLLFIR